MIELIKYMYESLLSHGWSVYLANNEEIKMYKIARNSLYIVMITPDERKVNFTIIQEHTSNPELVIESIRNKKDLPTKLDPTIFPIFFSPIRNKEFFAAILENFKGLI